MGELWLFLSFEYVKKKEKNLNLFCKYETLDVFMRWSKRFLEICRKQIWGGLNQNFTGLIASNCGTPTATPNCLTIVKKIKCFCIYLHAVRHSSFETFKQILYLATKIIIRIYSAMTCFFFLGSCNSSSKSVASAASAPKASLNHFWVFFPFSYSVQRWNSSIVHIND